MSKERAWENEEKDDKRGNVTHKEAAGQHTYLAKPCI